jgi:thioredoxin-related protein
MKIKSLLSIAVIAGLSLALHAQNNTAKPVTSSTTTATKKTPAKSGGQGSENPMVKDNKEIHWLTWDQMQEAMKKTPKKVFVDVYTDWCGWCKRMDASTFQDSTVIEYMNKNYYCIKYNAEHTETIKLKGTEYKFVREGRQGYHELAKYLLQGRFSYPTGVYLNETLDLLGPVPGYQDAKMMDKILHFFGDGYYLKMDWTNFEKTYVSPIFK